MSAEPIIEPKLHPGSPVVGTSRPRLLQILGPGIISGAADDDPTAIATYAQAGARFDYAFGWLVLLCYPLMVVVQEVSGRIGRTTGRGIIASLRGSHPAWLLQGLVVMLLVANVIQIGADLGVMADVVARIIGGPQLLYVGVFGAVCVAMQVFMAYTRYVAVLKWTTLSLLAYFAAVLLLDVRWGEVLAGFVPSLPGSGAAVGTVVAIFGVALSPYIVFWQSAQEAEDQRVKPERAPLREAPDQAPEALQRIRLDTLVGMAVACLVGLAIMITTATTLPTETVQDVRTSADAAAALEPVAGRFAFALFGAGIIGTGLLAVPVLAGSAAYALGEALRFRVGLARAFGEARAFYATLALAVAAGAGFNFAGIDPIQALYWSAVLNGVVVVPVLALMMRAAADRQVMGEFPIGRGLRAAGWIAVGITGASVLAFAATSLLG